MTGTYGGKHNALISSHLRGGGGGIGLLLHFRSQDPPGKTRGNCSAPAAILQMELETSAVPVCERTGYVGEHVLAKWRQK